MTDYATYVTATARTPGYGNTLDKLLDKLPNEAERVARGWLADPDMRTSHCARAITAMAADLIGYDGEMKDNVVARWRAANQ